MFAIHVLSAIEFFSRTLPKKVWPSHFGKTPTRPLTIRFFLRIYCEKRPQLSSIKNVPINPGSYHPSPGVCSSWSMLLYLKPSSHTNWSKNVAQERSLTKVWLDGFPSGRYGLRLSKVASLTFLSGSLIRSQSYKTRSLIAEKTDAAFYDALNRNPLKKPINAVDQYWRP